MPPRRASRGPESKGKPASSASVASASKKRQASGSEAPTSSKPASKRARTSISNGPGKPTSKSAKIDGVIEEAENVVKNGLAAVEEVVEDATKTTRRQGGSAVEQLKNAAKKEIKDHVNNSARARQRSFLPIPKPADHIRPPRTLLVFGTGDSGEFGLGDDERGEIPRPRSHGWIEEAIAEGKLGAEKGAGLEDITVGGMHSLAIDEKGRVWSWGVNDNGALGRQTDKVSDPKDPSKTLDRDVLESTPGLVAKLGQEGFRAVRVAGGDSVSIAISEDGRVRYWGSFRGQEGLLGFGGVKKAIQFDPVELPLRAFGARSSTFVSVAAGTDHVLALAADGTVYAMGDGAKAQLGRKVGPRHTLRGLIPEQVGCKKVCLIGTGSWHSFAVNTDGEVYAWGFNGAGQTGVRKERCDRAWDDGIIERPTLVDGLSPSQHNGHKVIAISAGSHHSLFLFDDGSLWGCGKIVEGEVGLADDHPAMTAEAKEEQCISEPQQIFFPPPPTEEDKTPSVRPYQDSDAYRQASARVVNISCGERHSLALTKEGHVWSWGLGVTMQLGLGADTETAATPTLVRGKVLNETKALKVAAGAGHCFILAQKKA